MLEASYRYLVPAKFDDVLRVHTRCRDVRGARFRDQYEIEREGDGALVAEGWTAMRASTPRRSGRRGSRSGSSRLWSGLSRRRRRRRRRRSPPGDFGFFGFGPTRTSAGAATYDE